MASHLDAGRSREIQKIISGPLKACRTWLEADVIQLLFRSHETGTYNVVALDCGSARSGFLPGEQILVDEHMSPHVPQMIARLPMRSALRPLTEALTSVLAIPWSHPDGHVWLVIGSLRRPGIVTTRVVTPSLMQVVNELRSAYEIGIGTNQQNIDRLFQQSVERLVQAQEAFDSRSLLQTVASTARWFMNSASAYVAFPSADPGKFIFVATDNTRTPEFSTLRLGLNEGLGGWVRREKKSISTANYHLDRRLVDAPILATRKEGFKSAVCTPLWRDGQVGGLLYVAERRYRAFGEVEVQLLERFANRAVESLRLDDLRRHHDDVILRAERERMMALLHDQVISRLLDLGIHASLSATVTRDARSRDTLTLIQKNAQTCIDVIRDCISSAEPDNSPEAIQLGDLAREFQQMSPHSRKRRDVTFEGLASPAGLIPAHVAAVLRIIGREAANNAERHSGGTLIRFVIGRTRRTFTLSVSDNGRGMPPERIAELIDRPGHLGLKRMRRVAMEAGGQCRFICSAFKGFEIAVSLPANTGDLH